MSQCDEILAMLRVGPATTAEILREVPCIVHSRIDDLRHDHGCEIECERLPGIGAKSYRYRLLAEPDPTLDGKLHGSGSASSAGAGSTSETPATSHVHGLRAQQREEQRVAGSPLLTSPVSCPEPAQLTLETAA